MSHVEAPRTTGRIVITTGVGVYLLAYAALLLTGHTRISTSADPGAPGISMWAALLPPLAAMALARLVPPAAPVPNPLATLDRRRLTRETWAAIAAAIGFSLLVIGQNQALWYPLAKVLILLVVPLLAFRIIRSRGPKARAIPAPAAWLAPIPAALAWFVLSQTGPLAAPVPENLPDPLTLAIGSLVTLLTAGILEEVFYHGWLQTRLEARYGRWPAILISALLFAAMHTSHLHAGAIGTGLASIVAHQGLFGLMQSYLWARYRNIWVLIAIHVIVNLVYVDLLVQGALPF